MHAASMKVFNSVLRSFHERYCMYRFPDLTPPALSPPAMGQLSWTVLTSAQITLLFSGEPRREWAFQHFLEQGSIGVGISIGKEWASHAWMSIPGRARPPHVPSTIAPHAYWIYFCATKYGYGGQGLYKLAQRLLIDEAFRLEPEPDILIDTTPDNTLSRRAIISTRFKPAGMLHCTYIWVPKVARLPLTCRWDLSASHPALQVL